MRLYTLEERVLAAVAEHLGTTSDELGSAWVAFASAVESVVINPTGTPRVEAIGKLTIAAVALPE
jgi:hypothetical protein